MRIVASVQAKRGSSRGLVHYIAHSKRDIEREPVNVRELFNDFADNLSVASANNSMRIGIAKGRPSNDELHHIVLSFRPDDYRKFGSTEKQRRNALKETTRAAMQRFEKELSADRLSWAAAVHLNTENPHVHIALQKQYFTIDLERETLTKIPREALPHFERNEVEKVLVPGFLIEAATERMEHLVSRDLEQLHTLEDERDRNDPESRSSGEAEKGKEDQERETLRRGIVAEYELRRIDSKIKALTDKGRQIRFRVSDPESGRKTRLSLQDIEQREVRADADQTGSAERQIRTILLKMLGKEEALKERMQTDSALAIRETDRVRNEYRKTGRKLPTPSFTKDEIDKLQEHCIDAADIRRFAYLEGIRSELERSREIEPRSSEDLRRIAARTTISDLTISRLEKERDDFSDQRYYRPVEIGKRNVSIAQLDREEKAPPNQITAIVEKLKDMALRLSGKGQDSTTIKNDSEPLRNEIMSTLNEQLDGTENELKTERNKAKMLGRILIPDAEKITPEPVYSFEQLAEIDTLSFRLKLAPIYDRNWDAQRTLIESATGDSPAARRLLKGNPKADLSDHKRDIIAGRALAREIVAKNAFEKAKEDLKTFTDSGRFHKFAVPDKRSGSVEFVSLHEVDLPKRGSLLDRALDEVFEGREHRSLRRTVSSLMNAREERLSGDVAAAKEILASASQNASEFKQVSLFGLRRESAFKPLFTSSEIRLLEMRAAGTSDAKEAARLRTILESVSDQPTPSLKDILRGFENPEKAYASEKERDATQGEKEMPDQDRGLNDPMTHSKGRQEPEYQGHSR